MMNLRRLFRILALSAAFIATPLSSWAGETHVLLVLSDSTPPYQSFATALKQASEASVVVQEVPLDADSPLPYADLVVAVGMKALESALAKYDVPVLGAMVPKAGYEYLLRKSSVKARSTGVSAIYLDQPWERQLDFIRASLPDCQRIGILHSPGNAIELATLGSIAKKRGLLLDRREVASSNMLFPVLEELLNEAEVLLAIPDSAIYNASNIRNILLTSYHLKVPLIGISKAYVNAGALGAIFSTPEQIAGQTAGVIGSFETNRRLPEPTHPDAYDISLNHEVARSMGVVLSPPEDIRKRMGKTGEGAR
ncbi:MAG: hypothetical protein IPM27_01610 [Nitrosomonadales bacterium]|nr:hypothetical protein [Nitrosomonadales bacterium]